MPTHPKCFVVWSQFFFLIKKDRPKSNTLLWQWVWKWGDSVAMISTFTNLISTFFWGSSKGFMRRKEAIGEIYNLTCT